MNKDYLYFIRALVDIQNKYELKRIDVFNERNGLVLCLLNWGKVTFHWNDDHKDKLLSMSKDFEALGLEVSITKPNVWSIELTVTVPRNPTLELFYGQT